MENKKKFNYEADLYGKGRSVNDFSISRHITDLDGFKLRYLRIDTRLDDKEDVEDLIRFLKVSKWSLPDREKPDFVASTKNAKTASIFKDRGYITYFDEDDGCLKYRDSDGKEHVLKVQ